MFSQKPQPAAKNPSFRPLVWPSLSLPWRFAEVRCCRGKLRPRPRPRSRSARGSAPAAACPGRQNLTEATPDSSVAMGKPGHSFLLVVDFEGKSLRKKEEKGVTTENPKISKSFVQLGFQARNRASGKFERGRERDRSSYMFFHSLLDFILCLP